MYSSTGESYRVLAIEFYKNETALTLDKKIEALQMANDTRFMRAINGKIIDDLHPIVEFFAGDVVVIPALLPRN